MNKKRQAILVATALATLLGSTGVLADPNCSAIQDDASNPSYDFAGNLNNIKACLSDCATNHDGDTQSIAQCREAFSNYLFEANYQSYLQSHNGGSSSVEFSGPTFNHTPTKPQSVQTTTPQFTGPVKTQTTAPTYHFNPPKVVVPNQTAEVGKETRHSSGIRWY